MARFGYENSYPGKLYAKEVSAEIYEIYYTLSAENLAGVDTRNRALDRSNPEKYKTRLLITDFRNHILHIYPLNMREIDESTNRIASKYRLVNQITLEIKKLEFGLSLRNDSKPPYDVDLATTKNKETVMEILENLPSGFVKDYDYGLGLNKDYEFLIQAVEQQGITHLKITDRVDKISIDEHEKQFVLPYNNFDLIRRQINRIKRDFSVASSGINQVMTINSLNALRNGEENTTQVFAEKNPITKWFPDAGSYFPVTNTKRDTEQVMKFIIQNKKDIAKNQPEELVKLKNNIEITALEDFIDRMENKIRKQIAEKYWQKLFNENPFVLSLSFGFPMIYIQEQAYLGGKGISGRGGKITDFLFKNALTNNIGLFEIKNPSTSLVGKAYYRNDVFPPSKELSGAITQVLHQKNTIESSIATIKHNSKITDIDTAFVRAMLIIGRIPKNEDHKRSFEIIRSNSKNVTIITFDELLNNLKQLCEFLQPEQARKNESDDGDSSA